MPPTAALDLVGLGAHHRKLPAQMSGGEQQRVGIARALVTQPALIVADEPTGALDQANGHVVFELLAGVARNGTTVVFITHDLGLAAAADRVVSMIDGRIESVIAPVVTPPASGTTDRGAVMTAMLRQFRRAPGRILASVFALALAVGAIGVLAIPHVSEGSLHAAVGTNGLGDIIVPTTPLDAEQVAAVAALPGVDRSRGRGRAWPSVADGNPCSSSGSPRTARWTS